MSFSRRGFMLGAAVLWCGAWQTRRAAAGPLANRIANRIGNNVGRGIGNAVGQTTTDLADGIGKMIVASIEVLMIGAIIIVPLLLYQMTVEILEEGLNLGKAQLKELQAMGDAVVAEFHTALELPPEERQAKFCEIFARLEKEYTPKIEKLLDPEQRERLAQVVLQLRGVHGMLEPAVADRLMITDEQRKKLADLASELTDSIEKSRNLKIGRVPAMLLKRKEIDLKSKKILSADQQTKLQELWGAPVNLDWAKLLKTELGDLKVDMNTK